MEFIRATPTHNVPVAALAICSVLFLSPAVAQSDGSDSPSGMSDDELVSEFGDVLREYDSDGSGDIGIDETGSAGQDFTSGELSNRKLDAVREAFNREGLDFSPSSSQDTGDGSGGGQETDDSPGGNQESDEGPAQGQDDSSGETSTSTRQVQRNAWYGISSGSEQDLTISRGTPAAYANGNREIEMPLRANPDNSLEIQRNGNSVSVGVGQVKAIQNTIFGNNVAPAHFLINCGKMDSSGDKYIADKINYRFTRDPPSPLFDDARQVRKEVVRSCADHRGSTTQKNVDLSTGSSRYLYLEESKQHQLSLPSETVSIQYDQSSNSLRSPELETKAKLNPQATRLKGEYYMDKSGSSIGSDTYKLRLSRKEQFSLKPWKKNINSLYEGRGNLEETTATYQIPTESQETKVALSNRANVRVNGEKVLNVCRAEDGRRVLHNTDQLAVVLDFKCTYYKGTSTVDRSVLMAVPSDRVEDARIPVASASFDSDLGVLTPGKGVQLEVNNNSMEYEAVIEGPTNTETFEVGGDDTSISFTPEGPGTVEASVKVTDNGPFHEEDEEVASASIDVVETLPDADLRVTSGLSTVSFRTLGYDPPRRVALFAGLDVQARAYSPGKYELRASGPGIDFQESFEGPEPDPDPDITPFTTQGAALKPNDASGRIDVKLVAPGEFWNPLDSDETIASYDRAVRDLNYTDRIETGEKFTANLSWAVQLWDGTNITSYSYGQIGPPYDDEPEGLVMRIDNNLRQFYINNGGKRGGGIREITYDGKRIRLCGYKDIDGYDKEPVFVAVPSSYSGADGSLRELCGGEAELEDGDESGSEPEGIPRSELSDNDLKTQYGDILREYDADSSGSINSDEAVNAVNDFTSNSASDISANEATAVLTARERGLSFDASGDGSASEGGSSEDDQEGSDGSSSGGSDVVVEPEVPSVGSSVTVSASVTESLAEGGYTIEVSGPEGFWDSKDVSGEQESELGFTPSDSGEYSVKVVPQSFGNGLPFVEGITQNGAEAETAFNVENEESPTWIDFCNSNGYEIVSLDQNLEGAAQCIREDIVPMFFEQEGEAGNVGVPQSLCQDVLGTDYIENQRVCGTPGAT